MLSKTVTPRSPSPARISTTLFAFVLSNPVVGSSRNKTLGDVSKAHAIETRLFSPPARPLWNSSPISEFKTFCNPNADAQWCALRVSSSFFVLLGNRSIALNSRCSHTVDVPGSTSVCGTYPEMRLIVFGETDSPFTRTAPLPVWPPGVRPARKSRSVDLPAPDGPKMANTPDDWPVARVAFPKSNDCFPTRLPGPGPACPATPRKIRRAPLLPGVDADTARAYTKTFSQLTTGRSREKTEF
mmetsp:Transcript_2513/g.9702  ORF Transcript_2513/g.9702 Transcript_2513/m.9702 type:complete len:242 (-) Transcript_2513:1357-2082(-)